MKLNLLTLIPKITNIIGVLLYLVFIYKLNDNLNPMTNALKSEFMFILFTLFYFPFILIIIICVLMKQIKDKIKFIMIYFAWLLFIVTPLMFGKESMGHFVWGGSSTSAEDTEPDDWIDKRKYVDGRLVEGEEKLSPSRKAAAKSERNERINIDDNIYA